MGTNVSMKMIMRPQPLPQQVSQLVLQLVIQLLLQLEILLLFPQGLPLSPILLSAAVVILQQLVLSAPKEMAPLGVMANASGIMINAFTEIIHRLSIVGVIWQILALNVRKAMVLLGVMANVCGKITNVSMKMINARMIKAGAGRIRRELKKIVTGLL